MNNFIKSPPQLILTVYLLISVMFIFSNLYGTIILVITAIIYSVLFSAILKSKLITILATLYVIVFFLFISWWFSDGINILFILEQFSRWLSFIVLTIVFFNRLSSFELISVLYKLKLPLNIAISIGVAMQFVHIITNEVHKNIFIFKIKKKKMFPALIISLLISTIRKIEFIHLSILLFNIQERVRNKRLPKIKISVELIFSILLLLLYIYFNLSSG